MGLIGWYLVRRILMATLVVHVFTAGLVVWTQVLSQTLPMIDAEAGPLTALALIVPILPGVSVLVLPLAFFIALLHVLLTMQADGEGTALLAAGASPVRLVVPGLVAALAIGAVTAVTSLWIEPLANLRALQMIGQLQSSAMTLLSGQTGLQRIADGLYLQHGPLGPDGQLEGVFLLDRRQAPAEAVYVAEGGSLVEVDGALRLRLTDGEMRVRGASGTTTAAGPDSYDVAFHDFLIAPSFFTGTVNLPQTVQLASTPALMVALEGGADPGVEAARAELARRLSDWLYPFAFAALAGWIALRGTAAVGARERRRPWTMVLGVGLAGLVRLAGLASLAAESQGPGWALAATVVPLGAALLFLGLAAWCVTVRPSPFRRQPGHGV